MNENPILPDWIYTYAGEIILCESSIVGNLIANIIIAT